MNIPEQVIARWTGDDPSVHAYPGAVALVQVKGKVLMEKAFGKAWTGDAKDPWVASGDMRTDCVFELASLSKIISTTTAALILLDRGEITLDDPVQYFFPETAGTPLGSVCIWHILTHTSGLPQQPDLFASAYRSNSGNGEYEPVDVISKIRPLWEPGVHVQYSCAGYIVLGRIIEKVSGMRLDEFARRNIFEPMGVKSTGYMPLDQARPDWARGRIVPSETRSTNPRSTAFAHTFRARGLWLDEWEARHINGDVVCGLIYDDEAGWLGGVAGNTGVFSTASDVAKFGQMWLDEGAGPDGKQIISPAAVRTATRCWTAHCTGNDLRGLGWQFPSREKSLGDFAPEGTFGHAGFTGTGFWIAPSLGLVSVLLTNRLQFARENLRVLRVRKMFNNAVYAEVEANGR